MHERYLHGDVKPENIIKVGPLYKLGDMGVAGRLEGTGAYPQPRTMQYRAPEYGQRKGSRKQTRWQDRVGQRYDIWSLGMTLHLALTKRHPYELAGECLDGEAFFHRVHSGGPRVLDVADPVLRRVTERCLEPEPHRRATAHELIAILDEPEGPSCRLSASGGT